MTNDDFLGKTSDVLNGLIDSIEKGIKDLQKETGTGNFRSNPFGPDFFKKGPQPGFREEAPAAKQQVFDIPACRIDTSDCVKIICELPGCLRKDIKLDYVKDTLLVRAKKIAPEMTDEITFREDDRRYGTMERRFRVGKLDASTIRASFKEGLLTITCNRPAEDKGVGIVIE